MTSRIRIRIGFLIFKAQVGDFGGATQALAELFPGLVVLAKWVAQCFNGECLGAAATPDITLEFSRLANEIYARTLAKASLQIQKTFDRIFADSCSFCVIMRKSGFGSPLHDPDFSDWISYRSYFEYSFSVPL